MGNSLTSAIRDFNPMVEQTMTTSETFSGKGLAVCIVGGSPHMVLTFKSCEPLEIEFPLPLWTAEVDLTSNGMCKLWVQSHLPTLMVIDVSAEQWDHLFYLLGPFSTTDTSATSLHTVDTLVHTDAAVNITLKEISLRLNVSASLYKTAKVQQLICKTDWRMDAAMELKHVDSSN